MGLSALSYGQQQGKVLESLTMKSAIMKKDMKFTMYLPPDYDTSKRSYPIVYLLHGYSDDDTGWLQFGEVNQAADKGIREGTIPPMIIAMPDGGVTWYMNDIKGEARWEDMFVKEFIPFIESQYRVKKAREFRGIAGLSMGGNGATVLAMRHTDLFAACGALSSAYFTEQEIIDMPDERYDSFFAALFGAGKGEQRLGENWKKYSAFELAKTKTEEIKKVRWWIDCGDDDFLYKGNDAMHSLLRDLNVPHEYRVRDGAHTWSYWRSGIVLALEFIGGSFHR